MIADPNELYVSSSLECPLLFFRFLIARPLYPGGNAKSAASDARGGSQPTYSFGNDVGMSMVSQPKAVGVSCPCHHQLLSHATVSKSNLLQEFHAI